MQCKSAELFYITPCRLLNLCCFHVLVQSSCDTVVYATIRIHVLYYTCTVLQFNDQKKYKIHTCVRTSVSTCSESGSVPGNCDKLNHTYSRDTPAEPSNRTSTQTYADNSSNKLYPFNQRIEYNKRPTINFKSNGERHGNY